MMKRLCQFTLAVVLVFSLARAQATSHTNFQTVFLILMENDVTNSEFDHFNTLSERFGIHFNPVIRNKVDGDKWEMATVMIPAGSGVFEHPHKAYLKEISTIMVLGPAKAVLTDKGDVLMAVAKVGKQVSYGGSSGTLYDLQGKASALLSAL